MAAYSVFDCADMAQRVCNLVTPHFAALDAEIQTGSINLVTDVRDQFDTPLGWPVLRMDWIGNAPGVSNRDWVYVFRGERNNFNFLDAAKLRNERPWYHYIGINQPSISIAQVWEDILVAFVKFAIEEVYHVTITASITIRELTEAATIHECRFYLGPVEDGIIVFVAALGRYVFEANQFGWTDGTNALEDAFTANFYDFDPTGGIYVPATISDTATGGGVGSDLSSIVNQLHNINASLEELTDETARVADQRTTMSVNNGAAIYSVQPAEIIEE